MMVKPFKTDLIKPSEFSIEEILAKTFSRDDIPENTIVAITSKIISLCEGSIEYKSTITKDELIKKEADMFLDKNSNFDVFLTIKYDLLIPSAGIDESNANGDYYIKLPANPQLSACKCLEFLKNYCNINNLAVIITDSSPQPLRWGVIGKCIACCGLNPINNKINQQDLFGNALSKTTVNVADALAASAVLCMGESDEQTPLCLIYDAPFVQFNDGNPSHNNMNSLQISPENDLYYQLLKNADWHSK